MKTAKEMREAYALKPWSVEQVERHIERSARDGKCWTWFKAHELSEGMRAGLIVNGYEVEELKGLESYAWEVRW